MMMKRKNGRMIALERDISIRSLNNFCHSYARNIIANSGRLRGFGRDYNKDLRYS